MFAMEFKYVSASPTQAGKQIKCLRERKAVTLQTIADHASLAIEGASLL